MTKHQWRSYVNLSIGYEVILMQIKQIAAVKNIKLKVLLAVLKRREVSPKNIAVTAKPAKNGICVARTAPNSLMPY